MNEVDSDNDLEITLPFRRVIECLSKHQDKTDLLLTAKIDDGISELLVAINDFEPDLSRFQLQTENGLRWLDRKIVGQYELVTSPTSELAVLIEQETSPHERAITESRKQVRSFSLDPHLLSGDDAVIKIAQVLSDISSDVLVSNSDVRELYNEIGLGDQYRAGTRYVRDAAKKIEEQKGEYYPALRLMVATCYRKSGQLEKALQATDLLELPGSKFHCSEIERTMLCTERAAVLMDLFEIEQDSQRLVSAERYLKWAWANKQTDHLRNTYKRFNKLKDQEQRGKAKEFINKSMRKIGDLN